jgi:hypothetical protein
VRDRRLHQDGDGARVGGQGKLVIQVGSSGSSPGVRGSLLTLGVEPPPSNATKAERLRFIRDFQVRAVPLNAVALAVVLVVGVPGWPLVAAALVLLLLDIAWLTLKVRDGGGR